MNVIEDKPARLRTVAQVAEALGISRMYVYSLINEGWIRPDEIFQRHTKKTCRWFVRPEAVTRMKQRRKDGLPYCGA